MVTMSRAVRKLRGRIAETGVKQIELAALLNIHPTGLSRILGERRPMPEGFEARVNAALADAVVEGSDGQS